MKVQSLFPVLAAIVLMSSCVENKTDNAAATNSKVKTVPASTCYMAIDGRDTAMLNLRTEGKKVTGLLFFNYFKKNKTLGSIKGSFERDTLLADYLLTVDHQKTIYRNPVAFLKKDGSLIMGVGIIETAWGRNYFSKNTPIDYKNGRFVFKEVSCKSLMGLESMQIALEKSGSVFSLK